MYVYIYINCTVNMGLTVSEKSVFSIFVFKGIYSHLKNISAYRRFYLTPYVWRYVIKASLSL